MPNHKLFPGLLLVDTGDPEEAKQAQQLLQAANLGRLDGATTNPSYFAKNPQVQARVRQGKKFTTAELLSAYQATVQELARVIPGGDISVEVYAAEHTTVDEMVKQARAMSSWIPTSRVKLPITARGLQAASLLKDEIRLNMTLCFSQQQAAAVYAATKNAKEPVFISPFIGRFDDRGENGVQFVSNVIRTIRGADGHVKVLAASFRSVANILAIIQAKVDVMTINLERLRLWAQQGWPLPGDDFQYKFTGQAIPFTTVNLNQAWSSYNIKHDLTDVGLKRFADDWNALIKH